MWDKIQNSFNGNVLWNDFNIGFREMMNLYQNQAVQTQPILLQLLSEKAIIQLAVLLMQGFPIKLGEQNRAKMMTLKK